jgi:hypothetical protein
VPHRNSPTLTDVEQRATPRVTACNPRDRLIPVLALETAQRLAGIVGPNAGRDRQERSGQGHLPAGCPGCQVPEGLDLHAVPAGRSGVAKSWIQDAGVSFPSW